jgi:glycine/D-amino acid oxidase-like deaminating enzyme/nitrite reductase/ring-hydroxylating ferredoxin subunit
MPNASYWSRSVRYPRFAAIGKNVSVDTLVVGGGLMGVTTAYLLTQAGQRVALMEREKIASGDTGKTTAHLTAAMDPHLSDLADSFGDTSARSLWDAGDAAIQQIYSIADDCRIGCDLATVPAYLHLPDDGDEGELKRLQADAEVAARLEIPAKFVANTPFFKTPGLRFVNQARFHPGKYMAGLLSELQKPGCLIFENTAAEEFTDGGTVRSGKFGITAGKIVIATHNPLMGNSGTISAALFQTKLSLYASYAVCAEIPQDAIADCLFWDTLDPYNYVRLQPGEDADFLIYGGKDHKTGQVGDTKSVYAALESEVEDLLAQHGIEGKIVNRWSGQVIETNDGVPYIGESAENQFAATGFSGNGMTFGTLSAMMATDWALGRKNPWSELLSPSRKKIVGGVLDYIRENADYPYYMMRDRLAASEGTSVKELKAGEGKILKLAGERLAVYRGRAGEITKLSPFCTHLGCVVHWNGAESTWDCPCHGSRFHATGEVMSGPAENRLEKK